MLQEFRKNTRSFGTYLLFGMITVVFVFTFNTIGPSEACGGGNQAAGGPVVDLATVGDTTIDSNMLTMAMELSYPAPAPNADGQRAITQRFTYQNSRFYFLGLQSRYGRYGQPATEVSPIVAEKAMEDLIETVLVGNEAAKLGLHASLSELEQRLITDQWFDEEGVFDRKRWENYIRYELQTTPSRFEDFVKLELQREKMIAALVEGMVVTDAEMAFHHKTQNEKVNLEYIAISDAVANSLVPVDDETVKTWLAEKQDEVKKYYDEHPAEFKKDERVEIHAIQVRAPIKAIIDAEKDDKKKAEMLKQREDAGKKAAELHAELMAKAAAPEAPKPEEGAEEGAEDTAPEPAPEVGAPVIPVEAFEALAKEKSDDAASKSRGGKMAKPQSKKDLARWPLKLTAEQADKVFATQLGQLSEVLETDSGFWIVRVDSKLPAEEKTLDQARMDIAKKLYKRDKGKEYKDKAAEEVLAEAKKDPTKKLADVAKALNEKYEVEKGGLTAAETGMFARMREGSAGTAAELNSVPGLGKLPELVTAAFAASEESPVLDGIYESTVGNRKVIARLAGREEAGELDAEKLEAQRERLLREKKRLFYRGWYDQLKAKAMADGRLEYSSNWAELKQKAIDAYREAGGVLATAQAPTPPTE